MLVLFCSISLPVLSLEHFLLFKIDSSFQITFHGVAVVEIPDGNAGRVRGSAYSKHGGGGFRQTVCFVNEIPRYDHTLLHIHWYRRLPSEGISQFNMSTLTDYDWGNAEFQTIKANGIQCYNPYRPSIPCTSPYNTSNLYRLYQRLIAFFGRVESLPSLPQTIDVSSTSIGCATHLDVQHLLQLLSPLATVLTGNNLTGCCLVPETCSMQSNLQQTLQRQVSHRSIIGSNFNTPLLCLLNNLGNGNGQGYLSGNTAYFAPDNNGEYWGLINYSFFIEHPELIEGLDVNNHEHINPQKFLHRRR